MSRTTALKVYSESDKEGREVFAGEGAVRQDGSLKVYSCNQCHGEVVWATSKRTGKKYLVNVTTNHNGARFYMKQWVHKCEEVEKRTAEIEAAYAPKRLTDEEWSETVALTERLKAEALAEAGQ